MSREFYKHYVSIGDDGRITISANENGVISLVVRSGDSVSALNLEASELNLLSAFIGNASSFIQRALTSDSDIEKRNNKASMFYIVDENHRRQRDSEDEYFTVDSIGEAEKIISFYFDMDYGDKFGIVDCATGEVVRWLEALEYED